MSIPGKKRAPPGAPQKTLHLPPQGAAFFSVLSFGSFFQSFLSALSFSIPLAETAFTKQVPPVISIPGTMKFLLNSPCGNRLHEAGASGNFHTRYNEVSPEIPKPASEKISFSGELNAVTI